MIPALLAVGYLVVGSAALWIIAAVTDPPFSVRSDEGEEFHAIFALLLWPLITLFLLAQAASRMLSRLLP